MASTRTAVNVLPGIMTEIRRCRLKGVFYLFDRCQAATNDSHSDHQLVPAHFQGIDANIGFGLIITKKPPTQRLSAKGLKKLSDILMCCLCCNCFQWSAKPETEP